MPRTCQWPTDPDDVTAFQAGVENVTRCGTRAPSFQATRDATADAPHTIDVCDVHKPQAEAAGWEVGPYLTTRTRSRLAAETRAPHDLVDTTLPPPDPERLDDAAVEAADVPTHHTYQVPNYGHPEINAMAIVVQQLDQFDEPTARRIATWVADRYGAPI